MLFYEYRLRPAAGWNGALPGNPLPDCLPRRTQEIILALEKDGPDLIFAQVTRAADRATADFRAYCLQHDIPIGLLKHEEITATQLEMMLRCSNQVDHERMLYDHGPLDYLPSLCETLCSEWVVDTQEYRTKTIRLAKAKRTRLPGLPEVVTAIHEGEYPDRTVIALPYTDERVLRTRVDLLIAARHAQGQLKSKRICVVRPLSTHFAIQNLTQLFRDQRDASLLLLLDRKESSNPFLDDMLFYRLGALVESFSQSVHVVFAVTGETADQLQLVEKGLASVKIQRLDGWEKSPVIPPPSLPEEDRPVPPAPKDRKRSPTPKVPAGYTAMEELQNLVGLTEVKETIMQIVNYRRAQALFVQKGFRPQPLLCSHMVFYGGPGTGKTTVARLLARILKEQGVLSKGHLVEVDRSDLIAGYVGQTAIKTRKVIEKAIGGVLFLDEAYSLTNSGADNDFGHEAIEVLIKAMEDHRDDFLVISAGYGDLMQDFLHSNPGLESRFPVHVQFPPYTENELMAIGQKILEQNDRTVQDKSTLRLLLHRRAEQDCNPRHVRNMVEQAILRQASRLMRLPPEQITVEDIRTLQPEDFSAPDEKTLRPQKAAMRKIGFCC